MPWLGLAMFGPQRVQQVREAVVIDLLHQRQQTTQFPFGEALAGKPVQLLPRQVGDDSAFVFAEGHFAGDQQFEFFGVHSWAFSACSNRVENTGILHAGQLTDHAKQPEADFL